MKRIFAVDDEPDLLGVPKPFNLVYMEPMVAVAPEQKRRPRP